ncbi:MAG: transporter substrate-binding domain-containing protein [Oscillospiraceae bacterium]|nr:transporter substrate-binding domain-containing protein [Oscillospiraceae bacterium]
MKKILALVLALCMVFALAACGEAASDPTDAPESEAPASEAPASEAPASEAPEGDGTFTTIVEGKLTMSTNAQFPPYEMTTDDGGFEGIDVEIATAIAEKLGLELDILDMDFDSALLAVQQGKSDIVMAGVTVNEDRQLVMDFTDSYATGVQVIIVKEGSDVTIDNMGEGLIGTQRGTTGNIYCTDDYGEEHVMAYDDGFTAVQALMNGQVDCVVIDNAPAQEFVKNNPGLTILDTEYANEDYAIGLNKGNTALLDAINTALNELISDGTVQTIIDKYIPAE